MTLYVVIVQKYVEKRLPVYSIRYMLLQIILQFYNTNVNYWCDISPFYCMATDVPVHTALVSF